MIVDDLDTLRAFRGPTKAHAPLIVDSDAVLPGAVALERFQAVTGGEHRNSKVAAASSSASLRVATFAIEPKLLDRPVSKSFCVSLHRKLLIMATIVYRLPVNSKSPSDEGGNGGSLRRMVRTRQPRWHVRSKLDQISGRTGAETMTRGVR